MYLGQVQARDACVLRLESQGLILHPTQENIVYTVWGRTYSNDGMLFLTPKLRYDAY